MPNYLAAPLKAITREMVVELSRRLVRYGQLKKLTYVGLGELDFVDFKMMYDRLGVERMYSIESEHSLERLQYNRPFDQIEILAGTTNDVLKDIVELESQSCIVWLDYTSRLRKSEHVDIAYLASKLLPGSALFVTVNCHVSAIDDSALETIEQDFGDYFDPNLRKKDYHSHGMGDIQLEVAEKIIHRNLSFRQNPPAIERVLDVRYQDSARMQVMGWIFGMPGDEIAKECRLEELDFYAMTCSRESVKLSWPELTTREWAALSRQMPVDDVAGLVPPHSHLKPTALRNFVNVHRYSRAPTTMT